MGLGDGAVVGTTQIVNNGSPLQRWNLVIVGDGYRQAELTQFATDAQNVVDALFATPPFSDLDPFFGTSPGDAINVYRIDVRSTDSGADDPTACGGSGTTAATFFDASFCNGGNRRLLLVNSMNVITKVSAVVPQWHAILVLVNSTVYGGSGGAVATSSLAADAIELALHELGHSAFGLADEYEYYAGCGVDTDRDSHPGSAYEPAEVNVTATLSPLKWSALVTPGTAIPTTTNSDCAICDPQANPVSDATVGAFEGARYYHCAAWRPQFNCKMRVLGVNWCTICQRRIREDLEPFRPWPRFWDLIERLERFDRVLRERFPRDWVVDPAPFDLIRFARVAQRLRGNPQEQVEDELSTLVERIETMSEADARTTLIRARTQIARLEAVVATLEASLKSKK